MPLNIALSGLNAASKDLEVTANNISNSNTAGFKGSRALFAEVFTAQGGAANQAGAGVRLSQLSQDFGGGNIESTNNSLDFAISGEGFFTLHDGSGYSYTRSGSFHQQDGYVINANGQRLQVYAPTATGGFDTSTLKDLKLTDAQSGAQATSNVGMSLNLPSDATAPANPFSPTDTTSYNQAAPFTAYDSLGATHAGTVYFVKNAAANSWSANLYVDGVSAGPAQTFTYNTNGTLATPATGKLSFGAMAVSPGANPLSLTVDLSKTTQFGNTYALSAIQPDGYPSGTLTGLQTTGDGVVQAKYTNGQTVDLGQIALANFSNTQGLRQVDNTNWVASSDSGAAVMGQAGTGTFGGIQSSSLESSNTSDLTAQLVNMIKAQRNYQANAQVISADQKMSDTILNLRG